jgi:hypothetical protein
MFSPSLLVIIAVHNHFLKISSTKFDSKFKFPKFLVGRFFICVLKILNIQKYAFVTKNHVTWASRTCMSHILLLTTLGVNFGGECFESEE